MSGADQVGIVIAVILWLILLTAIGVAIGVWITRRSRRK